MLSALILEYRDYLDALASDPDVTPEDVQRCAVELLNAALEASESYQQVA